MLTILVTNTILIYLSRVSLKFVLEFGSSDIFTQINMHIYIKPFGDLS